MAITALTEAAEEASPGAGVVALPAGSPGVAGCHPVAPEVRLTDEIEARARRAARRGLPPPKPLIGQVALALLEVEAGSRSPVQLERRCEPDVWERVLAHLRIDPTRAPVLPTRALVRVHCQEPDLGLANGVAVVRRDGRVTSISVRLEARKGRWVVTDLRMLVPLDGYLAPWPPPCEDDPL